VCNQIIRFANGETLWHFCCYWILICPKWTGLKF
jgi:hypothetical protein